MTQAELDSFSLSYFRRIINEIEADVLMCRAPVFAV